MLLLVGEQVTSCASAAHPGALIFQMLFTIARAAVLLLYGKMAP
jgi:hypothetical protein